MEEGLEFRELSLDMYDKGYMELLGELTVVGNISKAQFSARFVEMKKNGNYFPIVIFDSKNDAGTLFKEIKFIRDCGSVGHIEDIVVSRKKQGHNLGKLMIERLKEMAVELGVYKILLTCAEDKIGFYEKCGLKQNSRSMALYLKI